MYCIEVYGSGHGIKRYGPFDLFDDAASRLLRQGWKQSEEPSFQFTKRINGDLWVALIRQPAYEHPSTLP